MLNKSLLLALLLAVSLFPAWGRQRPYVEITQEADLTSPCMYLYPAGQPQKVAAPDELDVRSCDLSNWDFRSYSALELADVLTYDSKTLFPKAEYLPRNFDPERTLLHGTNPGLSIRKLHKEGIDGRAIAVAIIDENLLTTHQEYEHNLVMYQDLADYYGVPADTNATATASILVGQTVGVAPRALLYHFAVEAKEKNNILDAMPFVQALEQIMEINSKRPPRFQIKVVSIAVEFGPQDDGFEAFMEARRKLEKSGTVVFTANITAPLSRIHAWDDPDNSRRYCRPATFLDKTEYYPEYERAGEHRLLFAPADYRVVASPTGPEDYVQFAQGGEAWTVPYIAGLYTLGLQVNPNLTKWGFLKAWRETAENKKCLYGGVTFPVANFPNPEKLIHKLQQAAQPKTSTENIDEIIAAPRTHGRPARQGPRPLWRGKFRSASLTK